MTSYMSKDQENFDFSIHDPFKAFSPNSRWAPSSAVRHVGIFHENGLFYSPSWKETCTVLSCICFERN